MRIVIKTSKWAVWARRLARLAVPLVVIPIVLHHWRLLPGDSFLALGVLALATILMALILALIALVHLWFSGDQGWGRAFMALVLALLCSPPFIYVAIQLERFPAVTDMATTSRTLLPLTLEPNTAQMPAPKLLSEAAQKARFPNAETRNYPLKVDETFGLIARLAAEWGWDIKTKTAPNDQQAGLLNAQTVSWLGWRDEIVLRITGTAHSAEVDMRSASLNAHHDLGRNGTRIEAFLSQLDSEITDFLRDNPDVNQRAEPLPVSATP